MSKRKRVVLNFQQKLDILHQLDEGKSGAALAKEYGIGISTISDIKRNGDSILKFVSNLGSQNQISQKKTRKTAQNTDLDSQVYKWYVEEKEKLGTPPLDAAICSKALKINQKLSNGNQNFKASAGWLRHFKNRHALDDHENKPTTPSVRNQFRNSLKRKGFILENVYNASETVLEWNTLPNCETKLKKNVYLIACTNANASHKLPLWITGQEKIQNDDESVIYKNHQSFGDWFKNCFVPQVTQRQQNNANVGKVMLIIDDSSYERLIQDQNHDIEIFCIDKNLQPLQLGVKPLFKVAFRKKLLQMLLTKATLEFNFTDCIQLFNEAWNSVSKKSILRAWSTLLSDVNDGTGVNLDKAIRDILAVATEIPELRFCDVDSITQWLQIDGGDYIEPNFFISHDEENEHSEGPSHLEAYQCFETAIQWFEKQKECNSEQFQTLKNLRDLAASKLCGDLKQEKD